MPRSIAIATGRRGPTPLIRIRGRVLFVDSPAGVLWGLAEILWILVWCMVLPTDGKNQQEIFPPRAYKAESAT